MKKALLSLFLVATAAFAGSVIEGPSTQHDTITITPGQSIKVDSITNAAGTGSPSFTQGLKINDGASGTPSLTFSSDLNTGIYRAGSDDIRIQANGTDVLSATSTGAQIGLQAGSAATPALNFLSDGNTGLYWKSSDTAPTFTGTNAASEPQYLEVVYVIRVK